MDLPQRPGDALAQPTRARLFGVLSELRRPASTHELADEVGLHRNGVRVHLERLCEAGLVTRERTRQARGRPRDMWLIAPHARPGGDAPSGYSDLGRWLARVISPGQTSLRKVEATGREIGREIAPAGGGASAEETLHAAIAALGFQPSRELDRRTEKLTYRLCNCPYRDAVRDNQEVVCSLHRGMTRGLLDVIAPGAELTNFVPRDPYDAGCLVALRGDLAPNTR